MFISVHSPVPPCFTLILGQCINERVNTLSL